MCQSEWELERELMYAGQLHVFLGLPTVLFRQESIEPDAEGLKKVLCLSS